MIERISALFEQLAGGVGFVASFSQRHVLGVSEPHAAGPAGDGVTEQPATLLRAAHLEMEVAAVTIEARRGELYADVALSVTFAAINSSLQVSIQACRRCGAS